MNKEKMVLKRVMGFQGMSEQLEALCEYITQDLEQLEVEYEKALDEQSEKVQALDTLARLEREYY